MLQFREIALCHPACFLACTVARFLEVLLPWFHTAEVHGSRRLKKKGSRIHTIGVHSPHTTHQQLAREEAGRTSLQKDFMSSFPSNLPAGTETALLATSDSGLTSSGSCFVITTCTTAFCSSSFCHFSEAKGPRRVHGSHGCTARKWEKEEIRGQCAPVALICKDTQGCTWRAIFRCLSVCGAALREKLHCV